ncbi:MAG: hypothetical protein KC431_06845, partial [Myxococcales bacterium]|nr:hypothetical protein [Myxococcales bacterium]
LWTVSAGEARTFEPGSLVYVSFESPDPLSAVGVVVGSADGSEPGALVMTAAGAATQGAQLVVRDVGGAVPVTVLRAAS